MKMFRLPSFFSISSRLLILASLAIAGLEVTPAFAQVDGFDGPGGQRSLEQRTTSPDDYEVYEPSSRRPYEDDVYDPDADPELLPPRRSRRPYSKQRRYPEDHWYYGRKPKPAAPAGGDTDDDGQTETSPRDRRKDTSPDARRNAPKPVVQAFKRRSLAEEPPPLPEKRGGRDILAIAVNAPLSGAALGVPAAAVSEQPRDVSASTITVPDDALNQSAKTQAASEANSQTSVARAEADQPARSGFANVAANDTPAPEQKTNAAAKSGLTVAAYDSGASLRAPPQRMDAQNLETPAAPPSDMLTKMIGQMLLVGFQGIEPSDAWPVKLSAQIASGHVGGVVFMGHNINAPDQTKRLTGAFRAQRTEHALLIAVDQEGGDVQRLASAKGFQLHPSAADIGAGNDPLKANEVYARLAAELRQIGFNLNFGPVADLNRNAASAIIAGKKRSYGADPRHVTAFVKAFAVAHRDAGVLTALKHFPGHGATAQDMHDGPVDISGVWTEDELEPYRALVDNKYADMVMVGHLSHPRFSGPQSAPASLSREAVQMLLRGSLGYEGVTITDDLEMSAVSARYRLEETLLLAIEAGNDLLLMTNKKAPDPDLPARAIQVIRQAVQTGRISRERIRTSYERILQLKRSLSRMQKNAQAQSGAAKAAN